jgi:hypothetical protein
MKSSKNSVGRRCYTSVSWASREKTQMRAKVQGHSSIARAKKAHQVLTHLTYKFTVSTQMDVNHQKFGRNILDLLGQKVRIGCMILEKTATKPLVATQIEVAVGAKFKISLSIACSTKVTLTIGQEIVPSSWNPKRK